MQSNRQAQPPRGILDKKWVTYALALLLIALIAVFVASLRYQDEIINLFKNLFRFGREEKPQRPTIGKARKRVEWMERGNGWKGGKRANIDGSSSLPFPTSAFRFPSYGG